MILLLALGAPGDVTGTKGEVDAGYATEQVEVEAAGVSMELPPEYVGDDAKSRC